MNFGVYIWRQMKNCFIKYVTLIFILLLSGYGQLAAQSALGHKLPAFVTTIQEEEQLMTAAVHAEQAPSVTISNKSTKGQQGEIPFAGIDKKEPEDKLIKAQSQLAKGCQYIIYLSIIPTQVAFFDFEKTSISFLEDQASFISPTPLYLELEVFRI